MKILYRKNAALLLLFFMLIFSRCGEDDPANAINIRDMEPNSPVTLEFGEFVVITLNYSIAHPEGARVWVQPYTNGSITDNFLYSSSKVFSGNGSRQVGISVDSGDDDVIVDQLRAVMTTPDQDETLFEAFIDVNYTFTDD